MIRLGLIGYPLLQSLSPVLHGAALKESRVDGEYGLFPVTPRDEAELHAIINRVRNGELLGLNVTLPYKQVVIPLLDELTPLASAIGAVNTIFIKDGQVWGDNTDAPGFLHDLDRVFPNLQSIPSMDRLALVLGAGGAARAVAHALAVSGWRLTLAARRMERLHALVESLHGACAAGQVAPIGGVDEALPPWNYQETGSTNRVSAILLSAEVMGKWLAQFNGYPILVVNATSAGMIPNPESNPWPEGVPLPPRAFVYDLVYKPRETVFLQTARRAGSPAANGLGMLIEQAALAFERWLGQPAPREAMRRAIVSLPEGK